MQEVGVARAMYNWFAMAPGADTIAKVSTNARIPQVANDLSLFVISNQLKHAVADKDEAQFSLLGI